MRNTPRHAVGFFSLGFFLRRFHPPSFPVLLVDGVVSWLFLGPLSPHLVVRCRLASSSTLCQEFINLSAPCSTPRATVSLPSPSPPPFRLASGLRRRTAGRPRSRARLQTPSGRPSGISASSAPVFPCPDPPLLPTRRTIAASQVAHPAVLSRPPRRGGAVDGN